MFFVQFKRASEEFLGLLELFVLQLLRLTVGNGIVSLTLCDETQLVVRLWVVLVDLLGKHEVHLGLVKGTLVELGTSQVEVALGRLGVQLQGQLIGSDRLLELTQHVVRVTQVVEGRCVVRVEFDGLLVVLDGRLVVLADAQGISEVVV